MTASRRSGSGSGELLAMVLRVLWLVWRLESGFSAHRCDVHGRPELCTRGRPAEHRAALWWHHLPRWVRSAVALAVTAVLYGLLTARTLTLVILAVLAFGAAAFGVWWCVRFIRRWPHERHYVRPLKGTIVKKIGAAPVRLAIERDGNAVRSVEIEWAPEAEIGAVEQQLVLEAATTRLAIEAPEATWKLKGRERSVVLTHSEPPPSQVAWDDVAAAVAKAAANVLVFGVGKRGGITEAAYSESPHLMVPGGSGGGKSNLIAFLLLQELMRGSLIINLDPKWTSHLWLQGLPNVISAHETEDLHLALCWIGRELKRRIRATYYSAGGTGRVRGKPGRRVVVVCEELNYGMPDVKEYWAEARAQDKTLPKRSPAIAALSGLACAGRASDMHMWLVAQLLSVDSTGVKDSTIRTNAGLKAMVRWDAPGWNMAVGKHIPMPPQNTTPGRIQLVTGNGMRETQVPYLQLVAGEDADAGELAAVDKAVEWARALAVSGEVAEIPTGPEGVPPQLWPPSVVRQMEPSLNAGQAGTTVATVAPPARPVTIREAVEAGVFGDLPLRTAQKRIERAGLQPEGEPRRGVPSKYQLSDLEALARGSGDDNRQ